MKAHHERTPAKLREQYELERSLAERLRCAAKDERQTLYTSVYDELLARIPDHPTLTRKASPEARIRRVTDELRQVGPFLRPDSTFLELGPGDCALSFEVARRCAKVYAVDVSHEITRSSSTPDNFELRISDGSSVPVPPESVDLAYSDQLLEHLHPDDTRAQLSNVLAALIPGGVYVCTTPNRLNGPHDISKHFDDVATGFHLQEYTLSEAVHLFESAGFSNIRHLFRVAGHYRIVPTWPGRAVEYLLQRLPRFASRALARRAPFRQLIAVRVVAGKPTAR